MARPRKADDEKLVLVSTMLPPDVVRALKRVADSRHVPVSHLVRVLLVSRFRSIKTSLQP